VYSVREREKILLDGVGELSTMFITCSRMTMMMMIFAQNTKTRVVWWNRIYTMALYVCAREENI
jgi:hypothetical protein